MVKIIKNDVEINLHKLMSRSGLVRKKVHIRPKKGGAPFWSTRWIQEGADVRDVVESLGYEVVEEEKPEVKVTLKELLQSAYDAGKAAFNAGMVNNGMMDPKLIEILDQIDDVKDRLSIREGWAKGWSNAYATAPVPGVTDVKEPEDVSEQEVSHDLIKPAYEAGKMAFKAGEVNSPTKSPGLADILRGGNGTPATLQMLDKAWKRGWEEESKKVPEPEKVNPETLINSAVLAGKNAFLRGNERSPGGDEGLSEVVRQGDNTPKTYERLSRMWLLGWDTESDKKYKDQPDNFDTMPDVEPEPEKPTGRGSQKDRPVRDRDIPLSDRISGTVNVSGVGKVPAITVEDIQIGDKLRFTEGVFTVKSAWSSRGKRLGLSGKSRELIFEEKDNNGNNLALKKQKRSMVGVVTGDMPEPTPGSTVVKPPKPKVVKPEPEPEEVTTVPSTGPAKSVPQATSIINDRFIETSEDMSIFFSHGVDFTGLKLEHLNSIIDGFDRTLNKYDVRLNYIGWNKRKQSCAAVYQRFGGSHAGISFQKTATKGSKNKQHKTLINFSVHKSEDIEKWNRYLKYPESYLGAHEDLHNRIACLEACNRWTVDSSTDDPLAVTAAHEANHAIYYKYSLRVLWEQNMKIYVGDRMHKDVKCASVSEYGMTSMTELFAEVGAAVAFDIEIDSHVKQAYLDTIEHINK